MALAAINTMDRASHGAVGSQRSNTTHYKASNELETCGLELKLQINCILTLGNLEISLPKNKQTKNNHTTRKPHILLLKSQGTLEVK